MRKQHGVVFEAPRCGAHGEEMTLCRFAVWRGQKTLVDYEWFCPRESVMESCGSVPADVAGPYAVPQAVLDRYGDPGPNFVGWADEVPTRLSRVSDIDALMGGGGPVA